ncbi:hypothetical protein BDK51DRAFT_39576 [Blyttiomyces helicus]|uniref:Uncharacterized protein n=1 Tax=Blyttiomyces helicus TaxID=388810 RepID=A0A4P9W3R2_9FUNG|nr:hypothetical protein BDK51DRAFT_39576 [Blyttiomyces helicus]|eukprot:RKO86784.1 hypothetical protein BDK51DRAFT_39576 [Blyttiomyces helicus]
MQYVQKCLLKGENEGTENVIIEWNAMGPERKLEHVLKSEPIAAYPEAGTSRSAMIPSSGVKEEETSGEEDASGEDEASAGEYTLGEEDTSEDEDSEEDEYDEKDMEKEDPVTRPLVRYNPIPRPSKQPRVARGRPLPAVASSFTTEEDEIPADEYGAEEGEPEKDMDDMEEEHPRLPRRRPRRVVLFPPTTEDGDAGEEENGEDSTEDEDAGDEEDDEEYKEGEDSTAFPPARRLTINRVAKRPPVAHRRSPTVAFPPGTATEDEEEGDEEYKEEEDPTAPAPVRRIPLPRLAKQPRVPRRLILEYYEATEDDVAEEDEDHEASAEEGSGSSTTEDDAAEEDHDDQENVEEEDASPTTQEDEATEDKGSEEDEDDEENMEEEYASVRPPVRHAPDGPLTKQPRVTRRRPRHVMESSPSPEGEEATEDADTEADEEEGAQDEDQPRAAHRRSHPPVAFSPTAEGGHATGYEAAGGNEEGEEDVEKKHATARPPARPDQPPRPTKRAPAAGRRPRCAILSSPTTTEDEAMEGEATEAHKTLKRPANRTVDLANSKVRDTKRPRRGARISPVVWPDRCHSLPHHESGHQLAKVEDPISPQPVLGHRIL